MLIKTLSMKNFRQYRGNTEIAFAYGPEENVTVILGDNTFGKTTLLQAFNWCFYEVADFEQRRDFLINYDLSEEMQNGSREEVKVEITLSHRKIEYIITRTQHYFRSNGKCKGEKPTVVVRYKSKDGNWCNVKDHEVNEVINSILPQDLSTFFFFDTERVAKISEKKDIEAAVKRLLGLSILENAIIHIGSAGIKKSVIGKFYDSCSKDGNEKVQQARDVISKLEQEENNKIDLLTNCENEINSFEEKKRILEGILRDNKNTADIQKNIDDLKRVKKDKEEEQNKNILVYYKEFSKGAISVFAQSLCKKCVRFLKNTNIDDKGINDLTGPTIRELISRGRCICGQEICRGNHAYQKLIELLEYVPPESIGNTVRNYNEFLSSNINLGEKSYKFLEVLYGNIIKTRDEIQNIDDEIGNKSSELKNKPDMHLTTEKLDSCNDRIVELGAKRDKLNQDIGALKSDIMKWEKILNSYAVQDGRNREIKNLISYAEEIKDWLIDQKNKYTVSIRAKLEEKVNEIFNKMYHGIRRVKINDKYRVTLYATVQNTEIDTGESEGSNRVKNFAFIAGLVALAKDRIVKIQLKKGGLDLSSEPYPLVMDAPFSNADEIHTANIARVLPDIADQVIMFVMKKDWNYAEKVMNDRVGKKYHLNKISETYTKISL